MKFIIRDDDLNYFDVPDKIREWYAPVFDMGIPVGFSVISFVKKTSDVFPFGNPAGAEAEYPISRNNELIKYIKQNPLIEIMQHGCTHETKNGVFEYKRTSGLFEETRRGKMELERAFGVKINIFVPPHDAISNHGILAVEAAGMNIIRGSGFRNFLPRSEYILAGFKMAWHRLRFPAISRMPAYPYVVDLGRHKEAYAFRLNDDNLDYLMRSMRFIHKSRGDFIVTNHIANNNKKRMQNLMRLLVEARRLGFRFMSPSKLFEI